MNFENGLPFWFSVSEREMDGGGRYSSLITRFTFFMDALLYVVSMECVEDDTALFYLLM